MADDADKTVDAFNNKVAELIKAAKPEDLVTILKHQKSLVAAMDNNNQNAQKAADV
jgi:hypothetical protein